jgi:uncharacterized membrane protein
LLLTLPAAAGYLAARPTTANRHPPEPGFLFVLLLIFLGLGLTLVVEFAYLRDNFGVRMNTVFKFYYQAWVCLAIAAGYSIAWMLSRGLKRLPSIPAVLYITITILLLAAGAVYPILAINARAAGFRGPAVLDGSALLRAQYPDDFAAIDWLRSNAPPDAVIIEAPGTSYEFAGRISAFTGRRAVLGWSYHEAQWRGSFTEQAHREAALAEIFAAPESAQARQWLDEWNVRYIVIADTEMAYLDRLCSQPELNCQTQRSLAEFRSAFSAVFKQGNLVIYQIE